MRETERPKGIELNPTRFPRQAALRWRVFIGKCKAAFKPADAASSPLLGMCPRGGGWQV